MSVNKQKILETIAEAIDRLEAEGEHLVADMDLRSISNEQISTEVHLQNGEFVYFRFSTRAYIDHQNEGQKRVSELYRD